jgi:hypothetical protein
MTEITRTLPNLSPAARYVVRVRTIDNLGVPSSFSEAIELSIPGDSTVPNAPTGLTYDFVSSSLVISWTAPTTNTDSSPVNDLARYDVRLVSGLVTKVYSTTDTTFSYTLAQNLVDFGGVSSITISVRAIDTSGNQSAYATGTATNGVPTGPTGLSLSAGIRSLILQWTANTEPDFDHYEIHVGTAAAFTADSSNLLIKRGIGTIETINKYWDGDSWENLIPGTIYYVKMYAVDASGNKSTISGEVSATAGRTGTTDYTDLSITNAKISDLVVDKILTGSLGATVTVSGTIRTATGGARIEITSDGIVGYATNGTTRNLEYKNSDGSLYLTGTVDASSFTGMNTLGSIGDTIQSTNYVDGVSGYQIDGAGNANFNNVFARGIIKTLGDVFYDINGTFDTNTTSWEGSPGATFYTFDGGTESFTGTNATLSQVESNGDRTIAMDDGSLLITTTAIGDATITSPSVVVVAGTQYEISGYFKAVTINRNIVPQIKWYSDAGASVLISTTTATTVSEDDASTQEGWVSVAYQVTAPVTAIRAKLVFTIQNTLVNETHRADTIIITGPSNTTIARITANSAFTDDFNRANSSTLGNSWTEVNGDWDIVSNKLRLLTNTASNNNRVQRQSTTDTRGYVQALFDTTVTGMGLLWRYTDSSNYWRLYANAAFATMSIEKVVAGVTTDMGSTGSFTYPDTGSTVKVEYEGNNHRVYLNGKLVVTVTDSAHNTATRSGIYANSAVTTSGRWDNFEAGDLESNYIYSGTGSLRVTATASGSAAARYPNDVSALDTVDISNGDQYVASAWVKNDGRNAAANPSAIVASYYDSVGTFVGLYYSAPAYSYDWSFLQVTLVPPSSAAYMRINVGFIAGAASEKLYVDSVTLKRVSRIESGIIRTGGEGEARIEAATTNEVNLKFYPTGSSLDVPGTIIAKTRALQIRAPSNTGVGVSSISLIGDYTLFDSYPVLNERALDLGTPFSLGQHYLTYSSSPFSTGSAGSMLYGATNVFIGTSGTKYLKMVSDGSVVWTLNSGTGNNVQQGGFATIVVNTSALKYKRNVVDLDEVVDSSTFIDSVRPRAYTRRDMCSIHPGYDGYDPECFYCNTPNYGFIADEMYEVDPWMISKDPITGQIENIYDWMFPSIIIRELQKLRVRVSELEAH